MDLPELRTQAKVYGFPKTGLVVLSGYPKSGKTRLTASAPDSILLELEDMGADRVEFGRILELNTTAPDFWVLWKEALNKIMAEPSIKIVGIDTVDKIAQAMQDDISKLHQTKNMAPKPGLDARILWGEFAERVRTLTDALKNSGKLVVMVAHTRPPKQDSEGRITSPAGINVAGQGGDYIVAQAEMIGHVGVRVVAGEAQHFITFRAPSDIAIWRTRVDELADREIALAKDNPWKSLTDAAEARIKGGKK